MLIKEIKCKSCMTKSKLTDYVINPYTGCQHGCKYCYATFMKKWGNIKENWGEFVHVKVNCPDLIEEELEKNKPGNIWFSSVTDCYSPIEGKYQITRKILEKIIKSKFKDKFTFEFLTKSALIKRDFDLIKQLKAELGVSINTTDEKLARILEPLASHPRFRIETLKLAKKEGIKTFGFISPVFPGLTDLEAIFKELKFLDYVWIELLNTKSYIMQSLMPVIEKNFPESLPAFNYAINHPEEYYQSVCKQARLLEKKYGLKIKEIVRHD